MEPHEQDRLWRLVDNQLDDAARAELEQELLRRPDLRQELAARRRFDAETRALLQRPARTEAEFEQACLDAFDRDQAKAAANPPRGRLISWPFGLTSLLAVAALTLLTIGISSRMAGPLQWAADGGSALRGGSTAPAEQARRAGWQAAVQSELTAAYRRAASPGEASWLRGLKSPWQWTAFASPTADGAILVQVVIRGPGQPGPAQSWDVVFPDEPTLRRDLPAWADRVVADSRAAR